MNGWVRFLARALPAARANAAWPDLRTMAQLIATLEEPATISPVGLLPYEEWARLKADHTIGRRAAFRELPAPRLGDLAVSLRNEDKSVRRVHAVLDKVESNGELVRLAADITVKRSVSDRDLFELLFPATSLAVELALVRILTAKGVREVERISRGAVDACAVIDEGVVPDVFETLRAVPGAAALSLAYSTCANDVTAGDNDPFPHESNLLADLTRVHLGGRTLPHRAFQDRKFVATEQAAAVLETYTRAAATKNVIYRVQA